MSLRGTIIRGFIPISQDEIKQKFAGFASLLKGNIFVHVIAFIDESGHHDEGGKEPGSQYAVMSGFVDRIDEWEKFSYKWQAILNDYNVPLFHFTEWREASKAIRGTIKEPGNFKKSPYYGWQLPKLDKFLYDLAEVAGDGDKVLVGISLPIQQFQADASNPAYKSIIPCGGNPRRFLAEKFFENLPDDVLAGSPHWKGTISVFYDQPDKEWSGIINSSFMKQRERDPRLRELVMAKKQDHLPLQAADMVCYRFRQLWENYSKNGLEISPVPRLDQLILKSLFKQIRSYGHPGPFLPPRFRKRRQ